MAFLKQFIRALLLPAAALSLLVAAAEAVQPTEYELKAVFLFHFTQFVEWPASAFETPDAQLRICVLGEDPFGAYLDEVVRNEQVKGHPLAVRRISRVEEAFGCHILFISASESRRLESILRELGTRSILTVSDLDRAAYRGVMIRLVTEQNRVRMRINLRKAEAAGLVLSSKLLRPAEIVDVREGVRR